MKSTRLLVCKTKFDIHSILGREKMINVWIWVQ
jgi:hypothetical protein